MVIRTEDLKNISSILLSSLASTSLTPNSNLLELSTQGTSLILKMSTGELYVEIKLPQDGEYTLNATFDAELFLKLIEKITSEALELTVCDNYLSVCGGGGDYKFPLLYSGEEMFHIPGLELPTITAVAPLTSEVLQSIYKYNTREVGKGAGINPIQKLYYIDQEGCITFTQGACVNNFTLESPLQILINEKVVKLFKLFEPSTAISLSVGPYPVTDEIIQTRVRFESDLISITAILPDNDKMVNSMPSSVIRQKAREEYPFNVVVDRSLLIEAINRLLLFSKGLNANVFGHFTFSSGDITIEDVVSTNHETIPVDSSSITDTPYATTFDLVEWKNKLASCTSSHVTLKVGAAKAGLILEKNVIYVLPECS